MKEQKILIFSCEDEDYGLPVEQVVSIEKVENIGKVPNLPAYVKGIVSIRETLFPVIDLRQMFYNRPMERDEKAQLIIVNTEQLSLALLVQEVKELLDVTPEQWHKPDILSYQKPAFFTGVVEKGERLILFLDGEKLVEQLDLEAIENILAEEVDAASS